MYTKQAKQKIVFTSKSGAIVRVRIRSSVVQVSVERTAVSAVVPVATE